MLKKNLWFNKEQREKEGIKYKLSIKYFLIINVFWIIRIQKENATNFKKGIVVTYLQFQWIYQIGYVEGSIPFWNWLCGYWRFLFDKTNIKFQLLIY